MQETLAAAMPKIMAALGHFANDGEIKVSIERSKQKKTVWCGNLTWDVDKFCLEEADVPSSPVPLPQIGF